MSRIAERRAVMAARHRGEFSQAEVAKRVGVSRQTLSSWELGTTEPSITQAHKLARVLGVSVDELGYGGE